MGVRGGCYYGGWGLWRSYRMGAFPFQPGVLRNARWGDTRAWVFVVDVLGVGGRYEKNWVYERAMYRMRSDTGLKFPHYYVISCYYFE